MQTNVACFSVRHPEVGTRPPNPGTLFVKERQQVSSGISGTSSAIQCPPEPQRWSHRQRTLSLLGDEFAECAFGARPTPASSASCCGCGSCPGRHEERLSTRRTRASIRTSQSLRTRRLPDRPLHPSPVPSSPRNLRPDVFASGDDLLLQPVVEREKAEVPQAGSGRGPRGQLVRHFVDLRGLQ